MLPLFDNVVPTPRANVTYLTHALTPNQNAGIVAMHFIAMYIELSIYSNGLLIFPYAGSSLLAIAGGILNRSAIKSGHISLIAFMILTVLLSTLIASMGGDVILFEFLRSFTQFVVALISAYCVFIAAILASRRRMVILFSLLLSAIVAGAFAERFAAVRAFSDAFRALLYPQNLLYSDDVRDVISYGALRPRFLTREPSLVGIGAGLLISMIFLLWKVSAFFRVLGALLVAFICIIVMRSPTILFFVMIVFFGTFAFRASSGFRISWIYMTVIIMSFMIPVFIFIYVIGLSGVAGTAILGGGSYVIRTFGPPLIWVETLKSHAFFGLGLGSFDALLPIARNAYAAHDILALFPHLTEERDGSFLISNGFWEYWIFLGLVGGSVVVASLFRLFRMFGICSASFPLFASIVALQTYGGISAYRPWHMLFMFAAIAFIVERDQRVENEGRYRR